MHIQRNREPNLGSWAYRMLVGPAMVIDGLVHFITLGYVSLGLSLAATRKLAWQRLSVGV